VNAWGVIIVGIGAGIIYWAVKHSGSLGDIGAAITGAAVTGATDVVTAPAKAVVNDVKPANGGTHIRGTNIPLPGNNWDDPLRWINDL